MASARAQTAQQQPQQTSMPAGSAPIALPPAGPSAAPRRRAQALPAAAAGGCAATAPGAVPWTAWGKTPAAASACEAQMRLAAAAAGRPALMPSSPQCAAAAAAGGAPAPGHFSPAPVLHPRLQLPLHHPFLGPPGKPMNIQSAQAASLSLIRHGLQKDSEVWATWH